MTRIHVASQISGEQAVFLVQSWRGAGPQSGDTTIFNKSLPSDWGYRGFTLDASPEEAHYILAPHPVRRMDEKGKKYVDEMQHYAAKYGKQLLIFTGGDLQHNVFIEGAIVLKGSQYRSIMRNNEILVPPFVEDLGKVEAPSVRHKGNKPVVAFCGYAGIDSGLGWAKFFVRNMLLDIEALTTGNPLRQAYKRGIYFRRKAMRALEKDQRIETRFIVRKTFSGNKNLISLDPAQARQEYLENMRDCDLMLAPKGDGNFSLRFFEALSMGRIPLLIDTDTVLPLEEMVDYKRFVLKVPYTDIAHLPDIVADFYSVLSQEEFAAMQREARRVFAEYLRIDAFFSYLFGTVLAAS
ncbi:MAG TPA: exostosin family protein [Candidatus Paceibacterota bacterium]|nr:exostosin family protein [Candidatus Paceibacterota bacterium]